MKPWKSQAVKGGNVSSRATMRERIVQESEFDEPTFPAAPDADGIAAGFQANVFTSSDPGVENISFESLLPRRRALWNSQHGHNGVVKTQISQETAGASWPRGAPHFPY